MLLRKGVLRLGCVAAKIGKKSVTSKNEGKKNANQRFTFRG